MPKHVEKQLQRLQQEAQQKQVEAKKIEASKPKGHRFFKLFLKEKKHV